ncbi:hypothetical protein ACFX1Z_025296 [Malus domestica]
MYLGFCAETGALAQSHMILDWSFSNSNFSIGDALVTHNLPSFVVSEKSLFLDQKGSSWGEHGLKEFVAEVSSLGRLKHRNLVGLRGWCKKEKRSLITVYDYMENAKVLHRDIKASNVLPDKDMNARLGDFRLVQMHQHGEITGTAQVVGTAGYMAPKVMETDRGREPGLVDWVWRLMERGKLNFAIDEQLKVKGEYSMEKVEKFLHLGLLCAYPEANGRPTITQVMKWNTGGQGHPAFEDMKNALSSTSSSSGSDINRVGR